MKICSKCKIEKDESEFGNLKSSKDGLYYSCKACGKLYADSRKDKSKQYRDDNKEKLKKYFEEYTKANKIKKKKYRKEYYEKNKEEVKIKNKIYYENNKKIITKKSQSYVKKRKLKDPLFKLRCNISKLILQSLTISGFTKKSKTAKLLGCSFEEFQNFLGIRPEGNIHLDHICPCSQAQNEEELIKLQHFTNFRWLSAEENIEKSDKPTQEAIDMCLKLLNREWIYKQ